METKTGTQRMLNGLYHAPTSTARPQELRKNSNRRHKTHQILSQQAAPSVSL